MLSERLLTTVVRGMTDKTLKLHPVPEGQLPDPVPGQAYTLYVHVPFCERLCPYCSFNRFPYREQRARDYFKALRQEMRMLADQGYDFESVYVGGGTPTVDIDELCETIDLSRELFHVKEVNSETNPNHLIPEYLDKLKGRIQRLSVGVQSFDDGLLKQMDRYEKYGSGAEIFERIGQAAPYFESLNVDMIFNFPTQTEDILISDCEKIALCGCHQTTFSPLYQSHATTRKMEEVLGKMDYDMSAASTISWTRSWPEAIAPSLSAAPCGPSTAWTRTASASSTWKWTSTPCPTRNAWALGRDPSLIWATTSS